MKPQEKKVGILGRVVRLVITFVAVGAAVGLTMFGTQTIANRNAETQTVAKGTPISVSTERLKRQADYVVQHSFQGRIEARRDVALGFEIGGTLERVLVAEGATVAKGDVLATLDRAALEAERDVQIAARDALKAAEELAQLTADRQKTLLDRAQVSQQRYDEARLALVQIQADLRRSDAAIRSIDVTLSKTVLLSPFDGVVGAVALDDGTRVGSGQQVLQVFERAKPVFRVGLTEWAAADLSVGQRVNVKVSGQNLSGVVEHMRPDLDPQTRTIPVLIEVDTETALVEGAYGEVTVDRTLQGEGAWVPVAALSEGLRGLWTVFIVESSDGGQVVRREAVELLHSSDGRAYVAGALPEETRIIATGTHRLADGQAVRIAGQEG